MELVVVIQDVGYDSALSLIIDIRTVIPGSGTTAPVGWAALPLFQTGPGRYMASGYYHLPIFKVCYCAQVLCYTPLLLAATHFLCYACCTLLHLAATRFLCVVHAAGVPRCSHSSVHNLETCKVMYCDYHVRESKAYSSKMLLVHVIASWLLWRDKTCPART